MKIMCTTCGGTRTYLQFAPENIYRPWIMCADCGNEEVALWKDDRLYLGDSTRFSPVSPESTSPTTYCYEFLTRSVDIEARFDGELDHGQEGLDQLQ